MDQQGMSCGEFVEKFKDTFRAAGFSVELGHVWECNEENAVCIAGPYWVWDEFTMPPEMVHVCSEIRFDFEVTLEDVMLTATLYLVAP